MPYQLAYLPPPYVPNQMWGMPPHTYGMPHYSTLGKLQTFVFDRLTPPVQDRLSPPQSVTRHRSSKDAGLLSHKGRPIRQGAWRENIHKLQENNKWRYHQDRHNNVVIQGNNEGPMIFGKSTKTNEERDTRETS
jgi:hypothetical protein